MQLNSTQLHKSNSNVYLTMDQVLQENPSITEKQTIITFQAEKCWGSDKFIKKSINYLQLTIS